ncbi:LytTR family transcriptional regulator DNA-binding domain-containing protein [Cyclobacterium marinum]|uniref:LytTR family transcriptional regulator DNA-binding domain-containing protein n=1 Tax=Cyclobacterium marinum TaxID=104 RepID=UPI003C6DAB24
MYSKDFILLTSGGTLLKIYFKSIRFIKTDNYLSTFHYDDCKFFTCCISLKKVQIHLPDFFTQINRSTIINENEISQVFKREKILILNDGSRHRISYRRFKRLKLKIMHIS